MNGDLPARMSIVVLALVMIFHVLWSNDHHEVAKLQEQVASQGVNLEIAQRHIEEMEKTLDRVAPHTIPSRP